MQRRGDAYRNRSAQRFMYDSAFIREFTGANKPVIGSFEQNPWRVRNTAATMGMNKTQTIRQHQPRLQTNSQVARKDKSGQTVNEAGRNRNRARGLFACDASGEFYTGAEV